MSNLSAITKRKNRSWKSIELQRNFLDDLGKKFQIQNFEDWYSLSLTDILANEGVGLAKKYNYCLYKTLSSVYTEYDWKPFLFLNVPNNYFQTVENQRKFLTEILAPKLSINSPEKWVSVNQKTIIQLGGAAIVNRYKGNYYKLLKTIFPEVNWDGLIYPQGHWEKIENRRALFDKVSEKLNFAKSEDWYSITFLQLIKLNIQGVSTVLSKYKNCIFSALCSIYPEFHWKESNFLNTRMNHWKKKENLFTLLQNIIKVYHIRKEADFYRISYHQLNILKASGLYLHGGLFYLLTKIYPEIKWNKQKFTEKVKKSEQFQIFRQISFLFPQFHIYENYFHPYIYRPSTNSLMELDIFIPELSIAFEYQGEHHYHENPRAFGSIEITEWKDEEKAQICGINQISIIPIPYWCKPSSLLTYLRSLDHFIRYFISPVNNNNNNNNNNKEEEELIMQIKDTKELKELKEKSLFKSNQKEKISLPTNWNSSIDPTGYWITEKRNGRRVYWDGSFLYSRSQKRFPLPHSFIENLPKEKILLDGFLCSFDPNISVPKIFYADHQINWDNFYLYFFDVIKMDEPFEERMKLISNLIKPSNQIQIANYRKCEGFAHLNSELEKIIEKSEFDSFYLIKPNSFYEVGSSSNILEVKYWNDCEVKLLRVSKSLNTLHVLLPSRKEISIRCSREEFVNPPPIGSILTVGYFGKWKSGKLKYPFLLRRCDMEWKEVLFYHEYEYQNSQ